jgi:hypothetical protein
MRTMATIYLRAIADSRWEDTLRVCGEIRSFFSKHESAKYRYFVLGEAACESG